MDIKKHSHTGNEAGIPALPARCKACGGECVKHVDFMMGLPPEKMDILLQHSERLTLPKGAYLFHEGEHCDSVYVLHKGRVKLCAYDQNGQERIAGIFVKYETIWEGVLVPDSRYSASAVALTTVECCKLARQDIEAALHEPEVALRLLALLSKKLHDANRRNLVKGIADPKKRIAGLLLYRFRRQNGDTVTMQLEEMAGSLALRPETVSRKLKELERDGYVKKTGQSSIRILSPEKLMELVPY